MKMPKNEDNNFKKNLGETRKQHGSNKKIYIALGACLITVSAIAWSTYQSVNTFVSPFKNSLQLGNFAFYPRTSGNLSFKKIK